MVTSDCRFRIALVNAINLPIHKNWTDPIDDYVSVPNFDLNAEKVYYDGIEDTAKLIQFNTAYGTNTTDYAAPYCAAYTFPDGVRKGYLPSSGELWATWLNYAEVSKCFQLLGVARPPLYSPSGSSTIRKHSGTNYEVYVTQGSINLNPGPFSVTPYGKF